jgi:hypothetical protein
MKNLIYLFCCCIIIACNQKEYPILPAQQSTVFEIPEPIAYIKETGYDDIGLPRGGRSWFTRDEFRGRHLRDSSLAMRKKFKDWREKYQKRFLAYIIDASKEEQKVSGIPYQLVVAQAILESQYGTSKLAVLGCNLFGVKKKGGNRPSIMISDDSPTDLFNVYRSNWESLRHHSKVLNGKYRARLKTKDPSLEEWVNCLCGCESSPCSTENSRTFVDNGGQVYATSCFNGKESYSQKLLRIIKSLNL